MSVIIAIIIVLIIPYLIGRFIYNEESVFNCFFAGFITLAGVISLISIIVIVSIMIKPIF